jgi:hypothetical protein
VAITKGSAAKAIFLAITKRGKVASPNYAALVGGCSASH